MASTREDHRTSQDVERSTPEASANPAPFARLFLRSRVAFSEANQEGVRQWHFSPASLTLYRALCDALDRHLRGRTLDVGAGHLPLRPLVLERGGEYESVDIERRHPDLDHVDDAQRLGTFADASYDTIICSQVLEHVADPFAAMHAMARVLRPGGALIVTVPHLSRLHELPHDYYRYTEFGLRAMAEREGLRVLEVRPVGGLFTFIGQQYCMIFMGLLWLVPVVRRGAYHLNRINITIFLLLDRLLGASRLFPTSYLLVAERAHVTARS